MKACDIHVGLEHMTDETHGWWITDSMNFDGIVLLEITCFHTEGDEKETDESSWPIIFSTKEKAFIDFIKNKQDIPIKIEKNKEQGFLPIQMDWIKYFDIE